MTLVVVVVTVLYTVTVVLCLTGGLPDAEVPANAVELFVPFVNGYGGRPVKIPPVDKGNAEPCRVVVRVTIVVVRMVVVEFVEEVAIVGTGNTVKVVVPTTVLCVGV